MSGVGRYEGPVEIVEAIQFTGENRSLVEQWLESLGLVPRADDFIAHEWCVVVPSDKSIHWVTDPEFRADYQPLAP